MAVGTCKTLKWIEKRLSELRNVETYNLEGLTDVIFRWLPLKLAKAYIRWEHSEGSTSVAGSNAFPGPVGKYSVK